MADADQGDDRRGVHEIDVPMRAAKKLIDTEQIGCCRTKRHKRVHVRTQVFDLKPRAAIKFITADQLNWSRERKREPVITMIGPKPKKPFANNHRNRRDGADEDIKPPALQRRPT